MTRPLSTRKKVSTSVYFDPEVLDAVNDLAARMHMPAAELVRVGVEAVLNVERLTGEQPTYATIRNLLGLNTGAA